MRADNYYDLIKNALWLFYHRNEYAYFYGAKGQVLTDQVMDNLMHCEPQHFAKYDPGQLRQIREYSRGKIGLDCSGFISYISGRSNWSTGFIEEATDKTTPALGPEGSLLYTTFGGTGRHIGLDIGYGYYIDFPREGESAHLGKINETAWEISGRMAGVDYTGSKN